MPLSAPPPILDEVMPHPDVRERFDIVVEAPATLVLETACRFDLQGLWLTRLIFRLREWLMRVPGRAPRAAPGLLAETLGLGWGLLYRDDRIVVVGARCQPWHGEVVFTAIPRDGFARYDGAGQVKIVWTLEVDALGPAEARFSHETRVVATDEEARRRFRAYWRWARFGIVAIRYLMLPAVRRAAEAQWRASGQTDSRA